MNELKIDNMVDSWVDKLYEEWVLGPGHSSDEWNDWADLYGCTVCHLEFFSKQHPGSVVDDELQLSFCSQKCKDAFFKTQNYFQLSIDN